MLLKQYIREVLKEQNATKCLTSGAQFHTSIEPSRVSIVVDVPFDLEIDEVESEEMETLLHNSVELVLSRYWNYPAKIYQ